ncbi:MAG TPA: GNAT family N-acetyltransferase [bacterium]|nr:GNAT family N-acetyltransferase [bacterium]
MYRIRPITPDRPGDEELRAHLAKTGQERDFPDLRGEGVFAFGAFDGAKLVGDISVKVQPVAVPPGIPVPVLELPQKTFSEAAGRDLLEGFVQSFAVEEAHRRRGLGRRLQLAALGECRRRGFYQMRSWSSLDKPANYALKLALGFAVHPGHDYVARLGKWVPGAFFVKKL